MTTTGTKLQILLGYLARDWKDPSMSSAIGSAMAQALLELSYSTDLEENHQTVTPRDSFQTLASALDYILEDPPVGSDT